MKSFVFKIGGEAGFGIMSAGLMAAKLATRSGYEIFEYSEYPSIIRGGHNVTELIIGTEPVRSPRLTTNILIALNQDTITRHAAELSAGSFVIYDSEQKIDVSALPVGVIKIPVPLNRTAREVGGSIVMRNSVALGAFVALTGGSLATLTKLIDEEFVAKAKDVAKRNNKTAAAGYAAVQKNFRVQCTTYLKPRPKRAARAVLTGNDAVALGAIAAGMQFAAIYPMTPISNIIHALAPLQEQYKFIYKQPEDEISALTMAIGASFAGARSMTASAGGGFCLMTEAYGLAAMTETPVVIVVGMRGGPATGLPTWTEQGDLQFVLHAHQGEFLRIVLAPGDVEEAFHLTMQAFNLADKYQGPVIILMDKHICESHAGVAPFAYAAYRLNRGKIVTKAQSTYARYAWSEDGISPRAFPGSGTHVLANSDEHTEAGYSNEDADNRKLLMAKRLRKIDTCSKEDLPDPVVYGPKKAALTLVSWGSNKGVILDALADFPNVNYVHITWMNPFPTEFVQRFLTQGQTVAILEGNQTGQLEALIKEKTGITISHHIRKSDGRPFFVEEVRTEIKKLVSAYGAKRSKK